jgi:hypothetical protein
MDDSWIEVTTQSANSTTKAMNTQLSAQSASVSLPADSLPPSQILVDTFFQNADQPHGGYYRTQQIAELIEQANCQAIPFQRTLLTTRRERWLAGLRSIFDPETFRFILKHQLKVSRSTRAIAFCGFQRKLYTKVFRQHLGATLLLWEATKNYVAPYVAADLGFNVIALPHNLESLANGQDVFPESFDTEVESLAKATAVFCIAREETWLLRLKGVNAHYLPYYAPRKRFDELLEIREQRQNSTKEYFLILGSASHPPTREGMIEQIEWLEQGHQAFKIQIAGRRTEALKPYCDRPNFTLHGSVSEQQLTQLLVHAKAILIHQRSGGGAITRIPDMLTAGIPVIANGNACRSAFEYAGVYCYDDRKELIDQLNRSLETPEIPPRPIAAERRFIDCLVELSRTSFR